jgi:Zinc finger, C3HC4 type (RING finger)
MDREAMLPKMCMICVCSGIVVALLVMPESITLNMVIFAILSGGCALCCMVWIVFDFNENDNINQNAEQMTISDNDTHSIIIASESEYASSNASVDTSNTFESLETVVSTLRPGEKIDNTCSICENNAWQIVLNCGHPMCIDCYRKILANDMGERLCPFDRKPIQENLVVPIYV